MISFEYLNIIKSVEISSVTSDNVEATSSTGFKQGVNRSTKLTLDDGSTFLYKPSKLEHVSSWRYITPNELYKREMAAYLMDRALGFDLVPEVKLIKLNDDIGSAQRWVDLAYHVTSNHDGWLKTLRKSSLYKAAIFDCLIGNADRHGSNFMITLSKTGYENLGEEEIPFKIKTIPSIGYERTDIVELDNIRYKINLKLIDNGYSFPYKFGNNSVILSRFTVSLWRQAIPIIYYKKIRALKNNKELNEDLKELIDEESLKLYYKRLNDLLRTRKIFVNGYKPISKASMNSNRELIFKMHQEDIKKEVPKDGLIYDELDKNLELMPALIAGKQPHGVKALGVNLEYDLYGSLKKRIQKYLDSLTSSTTREEAFDGLINNLEKWKVEALKNTGEVVTSLYKFGFMAGVVGAKAGVSMGLVDELAIAWLSNHPNGILPVLKTFSDELRKKFEKIIESHYTTPDMFDLRLTVNDMNKEVAAERWKLERIVRTSTASISNSGRLAAWEQDPYKYRFEYFWNTVPDNRVKEISMVRWRGNPYSFDEITFLWTHQKQKIGKYWEADQYNQRCSISRSPITTELLGNRFTGQENNFEETLNIF